MRFRHRPGSLRPDREHLLSHRETRPPARPTDRPTDRPPAAAAAADLTRPFTWQATVVLTLQHFLSLVFSAAVLNSPPAPPSTLWLGSVMVLAGALCYTLAGNRPVPVPVAAGKLPQGHMDAKKAQ